MKSKIVIPGTYMFTRRVRNGQCLLRPDKRMKLASKFCLVEAAGRFDVQIHAVTVMSNHLHMVVTFTDSDSMPRFAARFHRHLALCAKAIRQRPESFWDSNREYAVLLDTPERILEAMVYCADNPSKADLVDDPRDWPGFWTGPEHIGKTIEAERPSDYFRADPDPAPDAGPKAKAADEAGRATSNRIAARVSITIVKPPGFPHMTDAEFSDHFAQALALKTEEHRMRRKQEKKRVLGAHKVLTQDPDFAPTTPASKRSPLRPRFASSTPEGRRELRAQRRVFHEAYDEARRGWLIGDRDVLFPWGTYGPRVFWGARCEGPPDELRPAPVVAA